jgi:hypothetical protein
MFLLQIFGQAVDSAAQAGFLMVIGASVCPAVGQRRNPMFGNSEFCDSLAVSLAPNTPLHPLT